MILLVFLEVKLKIRIRASQYHTSDANYKCNVSEGSCSMQILFPEGNVAVLTNLGSNQKQKEGIACAVINQHVSGACKDILVEEEEKMVRSKAWRRPGSRPRR
ncbi:uncharacterized protein LOC133780586 [Humulus lupulus]|uniref:uncharacterized protein LOC133780586 n=1 Tax=Humulus lupulus TaxID=3486 RepID=UPI002B40CAD3|nr:uncharacterized protein LOC133780586 [Humulus lupulus]